MIYAFNARLKEEVLREEEAVDQRKESEKGINFDARHGHLLRLEM